MGEEKTKTTGMTKDEFNALMKLDFQQLMAELSLITQFSAGKSTVFWRGAAPRFTKSQLEEVVGLVSGEIFKKTGRTTVMDFTSKPPY